MREIGSEFWKIEVAENDNKLFGDNVKWFISGRSALNYILEDLLQKKCVKRAWLPSWCCESMILPFVKHSIQVEFYPVYFNQGQLVCDMPDSGDVLLIMDYFGYSNSVNRKDFDGIVIRDLTHSIHSSYKYREADYKFGSLRKWTGISTGGFAISKSPWKSSIHVDSANEIYVELKRTAMRCKQEYIEGVTDDKTYLEIFAKAEKILENSEIELACKEDVEKAHLLNIQYIADKRKKNAHFLMNELSEYVIFDKVLETDCPLFVPILVNKRDELRHFLIQNQVYCPIHWPISKYHKLNNQEEDIYKRELSIICDQRYDLKHMEQIVKLIKKGIELC